MRLFLNAGFGGALGVEFLAQLRSVWNFAGIRQDVSAGTAPVLCREIAEAGIQAVLLVAGGRMGSEGKPVPPEQIADEARQVASAAAEVGLLDGEDPSAIEVGNEPDNAFGYAEDPALFAEAMRLSRDAIRRVAPGAPVITGGITSLSREALLYLERANTAGLPGDAIIGYHSYRTTRTPEEPADNMSSRAAEFDWLRGIAADRPIWNTEVGWHTAVSYVRQGPYGTFWRRVRYGDEQVADFAEREVLLNADAGALGCVWYQHRDGPTGAAADRFGIRRADGAWKPVAYRLRSLAAPAAENGA